MSDLLFAKKLRRSGIRISACLLFLVIFFALAAAAETIRYERPGNRRASDFLPADMIAGPHYRIQEKVVSYGYMDNFTVDSDFGSFNVTGDGALRKLLKEINAIAVLRKVSTSKAYLESVRKAGRMPIEFGENLITDPVDTLSGIPKGVSRLFSNVQTNLNSPKNPSEDSSLKQALTVASYKRDYAYSLGVDVYSSNSVLQKELNRVGWAGAAGSLSVSAALLPLGGPAALTVSYTRLGEQFNNLLKEEPPARLRQINAEKLTNMGMPKDLVEKYLDHPAYTPRHNTIMVGSLAEMKGTRGVDGFIQLSLAADDEETANFFTNMAEILRGYHAEISPIRQISTVPPLAFARSADGNLLIPFPLDYGMWTEKASTAVPKLITHYRQSNPPVKGKHLLWVTGSVTPLAKKELGKLGIEVVEHVDRRIELMD
ncbi:MAG: hypothetical protein RBS57_00800 [Desulforhabdus sp.]|jgi:hypothetical protein|nr:hypothetical protein [Desulforhabdus sp.]